MGLHVLGAAVWTGGVATLALLALGPLRGRDGAATALLRAFGPVAVCAAGVLVITGLYSLGREVATPDALLRSGYGQTLLLKVTLAVAVGALGAMHARRLHPRLARRGLLATPVRPWTLVAEALLAVAVLAAAGVLVASPPATARARVAAPPPSVQASGRAADLVVDVAVAPNRPGRNFITATVLDSRRPALAPISRVRFLLTPPGGRASSVLARRIGPHRFLASGDAIDRTGRWQISLLITRPGLPTARFATGWTVGTGVAAAPTPRVLLSDRPLGAMATRLAAMLAVLALAAAALAIARRRPRGRLPRGALGRIGPLIALLLAATAFAATRASDAAAAGPSLRPVIVSLRSGRDDRARRCRAASGRGPRSDRGARSARGRAGKR